MNTIDRIKKIIREEDCPYFEDEDIQFFLDENNNDVNKTIYQCLIMKAENTALSISGLTTGDTSSYFRRLAQKYRINNSGVLSGG